MKNVVGWDIQSHFWPHVDRREADECWFWMAGRTSNGYGGFHVSGRYYAAHRIACALLHGPPPKAAPYALHSCDNPACCNPHHLRWGSPKANVEDAIARKRHAAPPRNASYRRRDTQPKGAEVWNQTLTEEKVRAIWSLHLSGKKNITQIAKIVEAKPHAVADVTRGRSWRHLHGAPSIDALKRGGVRRGSNGFNALAHRRSLEARKAKR